METFEEATNTFLISAKKWLTEDDEPMAVALLLIARQLDKRFSAPVVAQYGLTYRFLAKRRPDGTDIKDPLEALLASE